MSSPGLSAEARAWLLVDADRIGNLPARQEEFNHNIESLAKCIEGAIQRFLRLDRIFEPLRKDPHGVYPP